jgi:hypothetical protein
MGVGNLILESLVLPKTALSILQCAVSHFMQEESASFFLKLRSYPMNSLNQTRQLIGIVEGEVQLGPFGTVAATRPIVPAPGDHDNGEIGGMIDRGK